MEELLKISEKGWTFVVLNAETKDKRFQARAESPDGKLYRGGSYITDNEARLAIADARSSVKEGKTPWLSL